MWDNRRAVEFLRHVSFAPATLTPASDSSSSIRARADRARLYAITVLEHYPDAAQRVRQYARELDKLASEMDAMDQRSEAPGYP